jgi:hypothetical protein
MRLCLGVPIVPVLAFLMMAPGVAVAQAATEAGPAKSPGLALGLSIAAPLAGYGMIAATAAVSSGGHKTLEGIALFGGVGLGLLGPSLGHFYTGHIGRGLAFSGGRLLLLVVASSLIAEGIEHSDVSESDYDRSAARTSMIGAAICGAGILGLNVWESIDSYRSAAQLNRAASRSLAVAPMVVPGRDGGSLVGLTLAGRY